MSQTKQQSVDQQAFDYLSIWLDRQYQLDRGSDMPLSDRALNTPLRLELDEPASSSQVEAWGLRISLMHLSCMTTQLIATGSTVQIQIILPGTGALTLNGHIAFCSTCVAGMYRTGIVMNWDGLASEREDLSKQFQNKRVNSAAID